ncbi:MAG: hypothetical protein OHK0046_47810 [Anaerolineae bacterium]
MNYIDISLARHYRPVCFDVVRHPPENAPIARHKLSMEYNVVLGLMEQRAVVFSLASGLLEAISYDWLYLTGEVYQHAQPPQLPEITLIDWLDGEPAESITNLNAYLSDAQDVASNKSVPVVITIVQY